MKNQHLIENPFRNAIEFYSALVFGVGAIVVFLYPHYFLLSGIYLATFEAILIGFGAYRAFQGWQVFRFQCRLLTLKTTEMSTTEVPLKKGLQYVGQGFEWQGIHTQRKALIAEVENEAFKQKGKLYDMARRYESDHHNGLARFLKWDSILNPWRALPDIGGKAWLHGLGDSEKTIGILESIRNGHVLILGTTRVGKTRLLSILINQDIRRGKAVIFLDPKGDLEILRDIYAACKVAGRLKDFKILHVGFPELSARLNTLSSYVDISDVATRVTSAMETSGEGAQFKDFAWKYLNITARCLKELNIPINYRNVSFYITRPEVLLLQYADSVLPAKDPNYLSEVGKYMVEAELKQFEQRNNAQGQKVEASADTKRSSAIKKYLQKFIEDSITKAQGVEQLINDIIVPLYDAAALDSTYYQKITASVGPVLDMINQSNASDIFSFENDCVQPEIKLIEAIKRKQVIYIGLNSLANREVSEALGKAVISDLVSCAARIYNANEKQEAAIYCDEFSEIVQDQFITLLNKSGGAGFQITAAAQTINDLGAAFGGNADKAKMLEGNLQTLIMMRVKNKDTADVLVNQLPEVEMLSVAQGFSTNDMPQATDGVYFNTSTDTRVSNKPVPMLHVSDLINLPKGHAFLFTNGGTLSKVQIPLPKNDSLAPKDFIELIEIVNFKKRHTNIETKKAGENKHGKG